MTTQSMPPSLDITPTSSSSFSSSSLTTTSLPSVSPPTSPALDQQNLIWIFQDGNLTIIPSAEIMTDNGTESSKSRNKNEFGQQLRRVIWNHQKVADNPKEMPLFAPEHNLFSAFRHQGPHIVEDIDDARPTDHRLWPEVSIALHVLHLSSELTVARALMLRCSRNLLASVKEMVDQYWSGTDCPATRRSIGISMNLRPSTEEAERHGSNS